MQCSRHRLLYHAETSNVTASCNWWPLTIWSLRWGPVFRWRILFGIWRSPYVRFTRVRTSLACRQNLHSLLKTTERHSSLQSTLSRHQSSCGCRCRDVSGSLARGERDLKETVPNGPWWHNRCNMCSDFFTWMQLGLPIQLAQCVELDVCLYYAAVQNLVYGCGNVLQITTESSDTPPIRCAQHV